MNAEQTEELGCGLYVEDVPIEFDDEVKSDPDFANMVKMMEGLSTPKIVLDTGEVVYGCCCWWTKEEPDDD
jgi:hypothetical protein